MRSSRCQVLIVNFGQIILLLDLARNGMRKELKNVLAFISGDVEKLRVRKHHFEEQFTLFLVARIESFACTATWTITISSGGGFLQNTLVANMACLGTLRAAAE